MGLAVSLLHTLFTDIKRHRNATGIRHMNYKKYTENVSIGTHHLYNQNTGIKTLNLRFRRDYARDTHRHECCCAPLKGYRVKRK